MSRKSTCAAPARSAMKPSAPEPANGSNTRLSRTLVGKWSMWFIMLPWGLPIGRMRRGSLLCSTSQRIASPFAKRQSSWSPRGSYVIPTRFESEAISSRTSSPLRADLRLEPRPKIVESLGQVVEQEAFDPSVPIREDPARRPDEALVHPDLAGCALEPETAVPEPWWIGGRTRCSRLQIGNQPCERRPLAFGQPPLGIRPSTECVELDLHSQSSEFQSSEFQSSEFR